MVDAYFEAAMHIGSPIQLKLAVDRFTENSYSWSSLLGSVAEGLASITVQA